MTQAHYDDLEIQTPVERSTRLLGQLPALVALRANQHWRVCSYSQGR